MFSLWFCAGSGFFLSLTNLYASCGQGKPYFKIRCISMKSHSIISADELFLQSIYLLFGFFEGVFYYKRKRSFLFLFKNISITKTQKNPDVCKFTTICSMCSHTRIIISISNVIIQYSILTLIKRIFFPSSYF